MNRRRLLPTILLATSLILVSGCQTTDPENQTDGGGENAAPIEDARARKEGGNVRSNPFLPVMPSEIERADLRSW